MDDQETRDQEPQVEPARPLKRRALVVTVLLGLGILADLAGTAAEVNLLGVLGELQEGVDVSFEEATAADDQSGNAGLAQIAVFLATVIAFLAWFWRAYRNLPAFGVREPRFGYGWAIGSWFVPLLNLIRPKQIANDIWRGTSPDLETGQGWRSYENKGVSPLLHAWWAAWLVMGFGDRIATRLYLDAESVSSQQSATYLSIVVNLLYAIAAVMAILVVRAITQRYEERRSELAS